ncbi:MAG: histidine kinase N-terminal 7TM domain-containing protein, partial [Patescibacteria group bacterium]
MSVINIASIVALTSCLLNIILALLIYRKAVKNEANKKFILLALVTALWALANFIYLKNVRYPWINLAYAVGSLIPMLILMWVKSFTKQNVSKIISYGVIFLTVFTAIAVMIPNWLIGEEVSITDFGFNFKPGFLYFWFSTLIVITTLYALWVFFKEWRTTIGLRRVQYNYIFLGIIIPTAIVLFLDCVLPIFSVYKYATFDSVMSLIFVSIIGYSITRYRFLDIRVIIKKGVVHFISIAIVLFLYLYLLIFSQQYLVEQYNWSEQTATIILVLIVVLTIEPLRRFLFKLVDHVFYAQKQTAREEARTLRHVLSSSLQFGQLINRISSEFQETLEVRDVTFLLLNKQSGILEDYQKNDHPIIFKSGSSLFQYLREHPGVLVTEE